MAKGRIVRKVLSFACFELAITPMKTTPFLVLLVLNIDYDNSTVYLPILSFACFELKFIFAGDYPPHS